MGLSFAELRLGGSFPRRIQIKIRIARRGAAAHAVRPAHSPAVWDVERPVAVAHARPACTALMRATRWRPPVRELAAGGSLPLA